MNQTRNILSALALACGLFLFINHYGMRQFGGFDQSIIVDVGWRVHQGQVPFRDFVCPLPALFVYGAGFAFKLFGVAWQSLVWFTGLFAAATFLWSVALLIAIGYSAAIANTIGLALQSVSFLLCAYWWYNPMTAIVLGLLLLSAANLKPSGWSITSYAAALLLAVCSKANVAWPIVLMVSIVGLGNMGLTLKASALAFGGWVFTVLLADWNRFFQDILSVPMGHLAAMFRWESLVASAGLVGGVFWLTRQPLALAGAAATGIAWLCNAEFRLTDTPPVIAGLAIAFAGDKHRQKLFCSVLVAMATIGVTLGINRTRMFGESKFFHIPCETRITEDFFRGLATGPELYHTAQQLPLLAGKLQRERPGLRVLFGPGMQWGYAACGLESPKDLPVWWHCGLTYRPATLAPKILAEDWVMIFSKGFYTHFPEEVLRARQWQIAEAGTLQFFIPTNHPCLAGPPAADVARENMMMARQRQLKR